MLHLKVQELTGAKYTHSQLQNMKNNGPTHSVLQYRPLQEMCGAYGN